MPSSYSPAAMTTAAIQAAINAAHAAGGGIVEIEAGVHQLAASAEPDVLDNDGNAKPATSGCIVLRDGVSLVGAGAGTTILRPANPDLTCIFHVSPRSGGVSKLEIDGGWSGPGYGQGHGILTLDQSSAVSDRVFKNVTYRDLVIRNVGAYGIGIQGRPDIENIVLDSIRTSYTGLDGIDTKYRGPNMRSDGCSMSNVFVEAPGLGKAQQTGIDVRGRWKLTNVHVKLFGAGDQTGVRFRQYQASAGNGPGRQAEHGTLSGFLVECDGVSQVGVVVGSARVLVGLGTVLGGEIGVNVVGNPDGNADDAVVTAVTASGQGKWGFRSSSSADRTCYLGCAALGAGTAGFRNDASETTFIGCHARDCAKPYAGAMSATASVISAGSTLGV